MELSLERVPITKSRRIMLQRTVDSLGDFAASIRRRPSAMIGLAIIGFYIFLALFADAIAAYGALEIVRDEETLPIMEAPSAAHPFGTTNLARDVFSQWIYGTRVVLLVGFLSAIAIMFIGSTIGILAGYYKGTLDLIVMRVVDIAYGMPFVPLILVFVILFGASLWNVILVFVLIGWRSTARVVRSETMSLAERPFVKAAKAAGASDFRIMYYHLLPNLLPLIFIQATIVVSAAIVTEAGISFLGLGVQDTVSWGTMLQSTYASGAIRTAWWWVIPPGVGITTIVLAFFYVSRAVEDIASPESEYTGYR